MEWIQPTDSFLSFENLSGEGKDLLNQNKASTKSLKSSIPKSLLQAQRWPSQIHLIARSQDMVSLTAMLLGQLTAEESSRVNAECSSSLCWANPFLQRLDSAELSNMKNVTFKNSILSPQLDFQSIRMFLFLRFLVKILP